MLNWWLQAADARDPHGRSHPIMAAPRCGRSKIGPCGRAVLQRIANLVLFLSSDDARVIHGASIPVFGNA